MQGLSDRKSSVSHTLCVYYSIHDALYTVSYQEVEGSRILCPFCVFVIAKACVTYSVVNDSFNTLFMFKRFLPLKQNVVLCECY